MIIEIFEKINFHNQLQEENLRNKKNSTKKKTLRGKLKIEGNKKILKIRKNYNNF